MIAFSYTFMLNLKFERLCLVKKRKGYLLNNIEGESKGVSINLFCVNNNFPYPHSIIGLREHRKNRIYRR